VEADKSQGREVLWMPGSGTARVAAEVGPLLTEGAAVHLKGEYIPVDQAYANGGRKRRFYILCIIQWVHVRG